MPDREQIQDLIDRAKAWTGETPLDADTFSLMRQMWTMLGELMPPSEAQLVEWVHRRNQFDYDECQHGTYSGGPSNGEPYAMCERQGKALYALLTSPKASTQPVVPENPKKKPRKLSKLVKQAASEQMGGYPDESLLRLYRVLKDEGL